MKFNKDREFIGKMFDEISPTYDRLNHLFSGLQDIKWRKDAVKYLKENGHDYDDILDLATGSGDLALEFLNKLNPKKIHSVDISAEMLKLNSKKLNSKKNIVIQAEAEHLPFEDSTFDLIGISFGVRNFEYLKKCVHEIHRVLKPGGKFLTIEMFKASKNGAAQKTFSFYFDKVMPKVGNRLASSKYAYNYLLHSVNTFLTADEYSSLLEECGLNVLYRKDNFISVVNTVIAEKN